MINATSARAARRLTGLALAAALPTAAYAGFATAPAEASVTPTTTSSSAAAASTAADRAAQAKARAATAKLFTEAGTWMPSAPRTQKGWKADFVENFNGPLNTNVWGRYMGGIPQGTKSTYMLDNATVTPSPLKANNGILQMRTRYSNGKWTSAGMSSGRGFAAKQGMWQVKAKFDRAYGVGYVFLLYPKGGAWPPEVDFAEGVMGGPRIMSTVHYGTAKNHKQIQRFRHDVDMTKWHTYGVILSTNKIQYTIDGKVWATVKTKNSPKVPMWLGIQAGVKDCRVSTGQCLSKKTPKSAAISIDWVAHYRRA
ncbi:beta-glucanase (GH16 family) [Friedmanniella endophytica]|uniref:Beta-glucanase (GH16 family) n=1 Tax=Microlunatus kandeliicorticis TaxID=1759536 RepID=A0A7W3IP27_9ACTN|nr:glycoside hydrolase family 16 protein [Microlunatus kandeliicorticis]MBA8792638.1 beta-glucanase (GH16 family) [Microlunatus kandeliicorticis]